MKALIVLAAVVTLTGCATRPNYVWVKEGATQAQFAHDKEQCEYGAEAATANYSSGSPSNGINQSIAAGIADGIGQGMMERELFIKCMKASGYEQFFSAIK